jgi:hypothetical protein
MKQVTNLLLVGSHKDRLTDGCRVQVYPACFNGVLTVWGGRSCARGAEAAAPQLHAISCNGRDGITVCAVAGAVPVGTVCPWHLAVPTGIFPCLTLSVASAEPFLDYVLTRKLPVCFEIIVNSSPPSV